MANAPLWKRVVGGVCGIAIVIGGLLLLRQRGVSGEEMQRGETAIVIAAAVAGGVFWIVKRQRRG